MNTVDHDAGLCRRTSFALPNMLTYGRIAAVPAVVACMYMAEILQWRDRGSAGLRS